MLHPQRAPYSPTPLMIFGFDFALLNTGNLFEAPAADDDDEQRAFSP